MRVLWAETRKLCYTPGVWVASGLCFLFIIYVYWQTNKNVQLGFWTSSLLSPTQSLAYTLAALATLGPMLASVVGAVSTGQEFGYGTWPLLLTSGILRRDIWLAKLSSVLTLILGWLLIALALGYGASALSSGTLSPPALTATVGSQFLVVYSALVFWALMGFTSAMLFRNSAAGVAIGMGMPFIEPFLAALPGLRPWLPVWNQRALNAVVFGAQPRGMTAFALDPGFPSPLLAAAVLTGLASLLLAASYIAIQRCNAA